jgi:hypothetical protein
MTLPDAIASQFDFEADLMRTSSPEMSPISVHISMTKYKTSITQSAAAPLNSILKRPRVKLFSSKIKSRPARMGIEFMRHVSVILRSLPKPSEMA